MSSIKRQSECNDEPLPKGAKTASNQEDSSDGNPAQNGAEQETEHETVTEEEMVWPVIVVGGGVAGLTTAAMLSTMQVDVLLLEAKEEVHGRTHTHTFPATATLPEIQVDLGANYIHGASRGQPVWQLAKKLGVEAPIANNGFWMDTSTATWFDATTAEQVPKEEIARLHLLELQIWRMIDCVPRGIMKRFNLREVYEASKKAILEYSDWKLTPLQAGILDAIRLKNRGYVSTYEEMDGCDLVDQDSEDDRDPPENGSKCKEQEGKQEDVGNVSSAGNPEAPAAPLAETSPSPTTSSSSQDDQEILLDAMRTIVKEVKSDVLCAENVSTSVESWLKHHEPELKMADRSTPPKWTEETSLKLRNMEIVDRLVVNGYVWLVDYMTKLIPSKFIRTKSAVKAVDAVELMDSGIVKVKVRSSKEEESLCYLASLVVVTVPLGVLKGSHKESCIKFYPPLAEDLSEAIERGGMGTHNKVILRFDPCKNKFWPNVGNFGSSDSRFQWLNLDYYGKVGTLCTHIYPPYAYDMLDLPDEQILQEVLSTLRGMFGEVPEPEQFLVQKWNADPFALGSYSFTAKGTTEDLRDNFLLPHPSPEEPLVYFAGEHTVLSNQCVTSAYISALRTGNIILMRHFGKNTVSDSKFPGSDFYKHRLSISKGEHKKKTKRRPAKLHPEG